MKVLEWRASIPGDFNRQPLPMLCVDAATEDDYELLRVTYRGVGLTIGYVPRVERENFVSVSTVTVQVSFLVWNRDRDRVRLGQWGTL